MYVFKQTTTDLDGRQAKDIQDFYYRGTEYETAGPGQGTGVRKLAGEYFRAGKLKERHIVLKDNGTKLEVTTYFTTIQDCHDFTEEPVAKAAQRFFEDRNFHQSSERYHIQDEISFRQFSFETMRNELRYFSSSCTSLEQVKERVTEIFTGKKNAN